MPKLLHFRLGGHHCAIRLNSVIEVMETGTLQRISGDSSNAVTGFVRRREKIVPIIDLKKWFSIEGGHSSDEHIIVTSISVGLVGLSVDRIDGIVETPDTEIRLPPANGFPKPPPTATYDPSESSEITRWLIDLEGTFSSEEQPTTEEKPLNQHLELQRSNA
jgi:chemotaxis signal transduction protein